MHFVVIFSLLMFVVLTDYQLGSSGLAFRAFNSPRVFTSVSSSALFAFVPGLLMLSIASILDEYAEFSYV